MTSLTKCLSRSSLPNELKAEIRADAKKYREEEGLNYRDAGVAAVEDALDRKLKERAAIVERIEAAGGTAPAAPLLAKLAKAPEQAQVQEAAVAPTVETGTTEKAEESEVERLERVIAEQEQAAKVADDAVEEAFKEQRRTRRGSARNKALGNKMVANRTIAKKAREIVEGARQDLIDLKKESTVALKKPTQAEVAALSLSEQRRWLLGEVEEAAKTAPTVAEFSKKYKVKGAEGWRDLVDLVPEATSYITFEVPGDGKFKVFNVRERLKAFASGIRRTTGFTQKKGGETIPKRTDGAISQSVLEFMKEGEFRNALNLAEAASIPYHFGKGAEETPVFYINSTPFKQFGVEFLVGRTIEKDITYWDVIHKSSGLGAINGAFKTKAGAMEAFKKGVGGWSQAEWDKNFKKTQHKGVSPATLRKRFEESDVQFSRQSHGAPRTAAAVLTGGSSVLQVQNWVAPIKLSWANGMEPDVRVVADSSALPAAVRALAGEDANGAYYDGSVYLIASNISSQKESLEVLAHETIGHHSMNDIVDDWAAMSAEVEKLASTPRGKRIQSQVNLRYGDLSPVNYPKEFLAVASEQQLTQGKLANLLQRVRAAIRQFLDKVGLKGLWSSTQLDALLVRAGKNLNEGKPYQDLVAALPDEPMFSKTPHHRQVEDPNLQSLLEKTNPQPASWWRKYLPSFDSANIRQGLAAEFHSLMLLDQEAGVTDPHKSSHIAARMSTSPETQMWVTMVKHPLKWIKGEVGLDTSTRGFMVFMEPVSDKIDLLTAYLAARRATRLLREGKEFLITKEEAVAGLKIGQENHDIVTAAEEWYAFNSAMLDFAQEAGYINAETRAMWNETDYVPFYRIMEEGTVGKPAKGRGLQTGSIKRLKGSERGVNNILENMLMNTQFLISAGMREHALGLARDRMEEVGMARKVPLQSVPAMIPLGQIRKLLEQDKGPFAEIREWLESEGLDASGLPDHALQQIQSMWSLAVPKGKDIVQIRRNGKPEWYRVDDPLLLRSLTAVNKEAFGAFMKLLGVPRRLLTTMVTATPTFQLRNWLRDTGAAYVLARHNVIPIVSGVTGLIDAVVKDDLFWRIMAQGGGFHSGFVTAGDPSGTRTVIEKEMKQKGIGRKIASAPRKMWNTWMQVGSAIENSNRMAIAQSVLAKTGSHLMAAFESKDFMDFSQRGDWPVMNFLTQTVPFLNARIQGNYRLYRGAGIAKQDRENLLIRANPRGFATHGLLITLATFALWGWNKDDDRYKELEEYDKDLHWHFWFGDKHIKLPKPFEVGILFGSMPERAFTAAYEGGDDAAKVMLNRMWWAATQVFEVNPLNIQAVKPIIEQLANREFFFDRPIEGLSMQGQLAKYRKSPWTHATSIEIGKQIGVSPARLDHLVRGYTGSIGNYVMSMSDVLVRAMFDYPTMPSPRIESYPLVRAVYSGSPTRGTKFKTEFYDMFNAANQAFRSLNAAREAGDMATVADIQKEHTKDLAVRSYLSREKKNLSDIYKQIRRIYDHRAMTADKKRELLDQLTTRKNAILKRAVEQAKVIKKGQSAR